ncbi:ribose ABC transporter [Mesobacillus campisalis]|uniref:D-ribose pyranase n=1 Tax=Mesobacillus campisalis TaxID=1408103 RepID=A0A0M2SWZ6_9BACI|nr:D-ribose pyranase [Mesobacillus campisalis]KKK39084.1 ribose ABC transporter [Mesobacillus campisalis]
MKKQGMLNSSITKVLVDLGHTDYIVIADAGLPVPEGVVKIDMALKPGTPSFEEVVEAVADDMVIEKVAFATEIHGANEAAAAFLTKQFSETERVEVSHDELKKLSRQAKAVIRTGEVTPYANCILYSGVFF